MTAVHLNKLLDTWRIEDRANISPVATLNRLVFIYFLNLLFNILVFNINFYKFGSVVLSYTQEIRVLNNQLPSLWSLYVLSEP